MQEKQNYLYCTNLQYAFLMLVWQGALAIREKAAKQYAIYEITIIWK